MNKIVQENAIVEGRADISYWDVPHSTAIEGFATDMSVNAGARVDFKINVDSGAGSDYRVEIFRLGYYGGSGAREVAEWTNTNATVQPDALVDASRGLVDAGNWSVTDGWNVPADAVSGVYLARLQRLDSNGDPIDGAVNQIPFIVRNDGEAHDIVLQTSDTTWQAYNAWGGNNGEVGANLYGDRNDSINWDPIPGAGSHSQDRAYAVSYNRPFITRDGTSPAAGAQNYLFGADYSAIYWLEKQGYDVSYICGIDTDRLGADYLKNYKSFISVGHDEYWSGDQRANVEEARDAGVNLLFWSGNEVYWKTRWDTAYSADGTPYRTLVCYKETLAVADPSAGPSDYYNLDPTDIWTGTWMDTRFHGNPLAGGGNPEDVDPLTGLNPACHCAQNQLTGQLFGPDGTGQFGGALDVPSNYGNMRYWRDTAAANGGELDMAPGIIGYEWDTSPDDNMRPAGLIKLSETTLPWNGILIDQGNTTAPGVATHTLSLYRSPSGALVFGAGTTFWSWALSDLHDSSPYGASIENLDIQQFTINMFADMGIQPAVADAFLISQGLKRATGSSDTTAAVASIDDLPDTVEAFRPVTISGTATDNDGNALTTDGVVAAVEVSVDGGTTWKLASTSTYWATWSYNWVPTAQGAQAVKARAIDDSLNVYNLTPDSEAVTVTAPTTFSLFSGATPFSPFLNNDETTVEVGMRFSVDRAGSVTELKYWRGSGDTSDTDVREGHLWRADGTLIATATFTSGVGQAGWQVATLSAPVTLTAGQQYVVSYRTNDYYVSTGNFFVDANDVAFDGLDNNSFWGLGGVVRAVQNGVDGTNGVYYYGNGTPVMPSLSFEGANYWVDITFDATSAPSNSAPVITSAATRSSPENRLAVGTVSAIDGDGNPLTYAITGGADAARFAINASTGALSFVSAPDYETPADADADNVYNLTVSVSDGIAPAVSQDIAVSVANLPESGGDSSSVFGPTDVPAATETSETTDYELGMRFTVNATGAITELRYYRGAADANDTDTRVLNLWNAAGTRLGSVTVTSTSGQSGWQVGTLSAPIMVLAGATYIVSYGTTQNYAYTQNYFGTEHTGPDGILTASANGGVFADGTPGVFPTATWNASNYWADVTFVPGTTANTAPVITSAAAFTLPENGTAVGTIVATDVNGDVLAYAITGGADAALFAINASTGALRFITTPDFETPADAGGDNVYDVTVSVSDGFAPAVNQAITVAVTDLVETGSSNVFGPTDAPAATETNDPADYELGMKFTVNVAGSITELRYYRGPADAGDIDARVLNLWSASGTLLESVSVTSEAGQSGWQVGTLSTPITVQAGGSYVVSYGTTQNYAVTQNYFNTAHSGPDGVLTAGPNSGVFADGTPGVFPTATWAASNYWVDVTLVPTVTNSAPVITSAAAYAIAENQLAVGTVTATDSNGNPLTYALAGGADAARFAIDAATGSLSFLSAPDYEAPTDLDGNNIYNVTVNVSDGIAPAVSQAIAITVTDVTETPANSAPVFTSLATASAAENQLIAATVAATDVNGDPLTYAIAGGADAALFTIDAATGVLSFASAPDFELPTDTGANNVYDVTVSVTDGLSPAVNQALAVTVTNVAENSAPVFTSSATASAEENQLLAATVSATDADGTPLTYAIAGGADAALFTIDATTGVLSFLSAPDYEAPTDAGANNVYDVTVGVSDGIAPIVTQALAVTVTDSGENSAPVFTSPATASAEENQFLATTVSATDADGTPLTYAIAGGADAALFTIDATTGVLSFASAPDFEAPTDAGANNVYDVTVGVSDGIAPIVTQALAVTVTDSGENSAPVFTSPATASAEENQFLATTVSATDADGNPLTYAIAGGADAALFTIDATTGVLSFASAPDFEAPTDTGANNVYDVMVSVTDGLSPGVNQALAVTVTNVAENSAPVFTSSATASAEENQLLATTVSATDADGNPLTYAIAGGADAALFTIDAATGVLSFASAPDFEAPTDTGANNVYDVMVSVTDGLSPGVNQALAVTVTNVAENSAPVFTSSATASAEENQLLATTVSATDADGNPLTYAIAGGADAALFTIDAATGVLSFASAPDFEAPADAGANNVYDVMVSVTDGLSPGVNQALAITVTNVAENSAPVFTSSATASAEENQLLATTVSATDADGNPLTYAIAGGADAALFTIDATTGVLSFVSAPDYEAPADTGTNNVYDVTVGVSDGIAPIVTQTLAISVTDVADTNFAPTILAIAAPNTNEDAPAPVQIDLLAGADDPEGNPITVLSPVSVTSSNAARIVAFTVSATGVLSFDPAQFGGLNAGQFELVTISYQISDGVNVGVANTATITVEGRDEVVAGQIINGTSGNNTLTGGEGNDTISGLAGTDTIRGNGGNDTINGGTGTDNIDAGAGNDLILIAGNEATSDTIAGGLDTDTVKITGTVDAALTSTAQMSGIEIFDGSGLSLRGTGSANNFNFSTYTLTNVAGILTLGGSDTVVGSAGADVIDGGGGTDDINGGLGDDVIRATGSEAQADTMAGAGGTDTLQIYGSADLTLGGTSTITGIEVLDGGGRSIVGTSGANSIDLSIFTTVTNLTGVRGLGGNDTLTGGNFADRLDGGAGTDTVRGGAGDDTIVVRTNEAVNDTIDGGAGTADRLLVDGSSNLSLTNTGRITGIERIEGGGGAFVGSSSADTLDFSGISVSGISSIQGGSGNDTIGGGTGADVLTGGSGNDSFVFRINVGAGADWITDFDVSGNDVIRLVGFAPSSDLASATSFDAQGALVDLTDIGGSGTIRLTGVTSLNFTTEDFLFV